MKILLILWIITGYTQLFGFDALTEYKLKLQEQFRPTKKWHFLELDQNFALDTSNPDSFIKRPPCMQITGQRIYVLDNNLHKLVAFNKKGKFIETAGIKGKGPGDVHYPIWFEIYETNIYISNNNGIDVFDHQLKFVKRIRNFILSRNFHILDDKIYSVTPTGYQGRFPLFLGMNMDGAVQKEFCDDELMNTVIKYDKKGTVTSLDGQLVFVPRNKNLVFSFARKSHLKKKNKIKYPFLDEVEAWNKRIDIDPKIKNKAVAVWLANLFSSVKPHDGKLYLLLRIPRLEILCIDLEGNILEHFYNDDDFRFMRWYDFAICKENEQTVFYVLGASDGEEKRKGMDEFGVYRVVPARKRK